MSTNDSNVSNIEKAEVIANIIGNIGSLVADRFKNPLVSNLWDVMSGHAGLTTSLGDLFDKLKNGTATGDDIADVLENVAGILAGVGVAAEMANPWTLTAVGVIGAGRLVIDLADSNSPLRKMIDELGVTDKWGNLLQTKTWDELSPEEKQRLEDLGFIPYDPDLVYDPKNIIPNTPTDPNTNPADGHPFAPLPPLQRRDPLVLDMNKDGLISTVSLADSTAFFDLTGDGIKEKVGWVQASEGIVAFDKNGNGKIDGISEVFGTATTSGFAELRTLADSNYDNVIDRRDELYNQLKVWQDTNQDGISQASELKSLSQAGVNNIELNVFATNINLNGNLLTEAGRYFKLNLAQRKVA